MCQDEKLTLLGKLKSNTFQRNIPWFQRSTVQNDTENIVSYNIPPSFKIQVLFNK